MISPVIGYAPDTDQTSQGVIIDCDAFVPTEKGMQAAPSAQDGNVDTLASACYGAVTLKKLDGSFRVLAGTTTKLYELSGSSWADRTRSVGGDYALGVDNYWRYAQYGDVTLAVAKTDTLQESTTTTFANVTGAPKASLVETVGRFVFIADTDETTYGDSPNRWWCSAINDYTDWTPSIATQCATNNLTSSPGRIYGMKRFGEQIVFYKERSMFLGTYVGAPIIWDVQEIPGDAGCNSQEAIVNIGTSDNPVHLFMGADDFWRFDGARPLPIGGPVRKTVYAELDFDYANKIKTLHDRVNSRVYFFYPIAGNSGALTQCVVYHYRENRWGRDDRMIEAAFEYIAGGITWDTFPFASWDAIPSTLSWDSPFWTSGAIAPAVFNTSHELLTLDGIATNSSFTTGDYGDDTNYYLLQRVKPTWLSSPSSATMTHYFKASEGDALTTGQTVSMSQSRFDLLMSSRWHRLQFNMVGDCVLNKVDAMYMQDGSE